LLDCVVVKVRAFTLSDRLTVEFDLKPVKRPVDVVNELGFAEFGIGVFDPED
tara:strand:+ start:174 stop:329 length:156 start_codon:yes stop_codon:yes gene_type:complete